MLLHSLHDYKQTVHVQPDPLSRSGSALARRTARRRLRRAHLRLPVAHLGVEALERRLGPLGRALARLARAAATATAAGTGTCARRVVAPGTALRLTTGGGDGPAHERGEGGGCVSVCAKEEREQRRREGTHDDWAARELTGGAGARRAVRGLLVAAREGSTMTARGGRRQQGRKAEETSAREEDGPSTRMALTVGGFEGARRRRT